MHIESYVANKRKYYRFRTRNKDGDYVKQLGTSEKIHDVMINFAKLKDYLVEANKKGNISHEVLREINTIMTTKNLDTSKSQSFEEENIV